ncbi:unnamed protein product [Adineta ricciae]|uniref:Hint domain-containing protein n=1 Tax=Adineta ricciae TaxID=249248 RepID=A0A814HSQ5_ADIRI|nr:unnamed protein product [Adineta ricciae]
MLIFTIFIAFLLITNKINAADDEGKGASASSTDVSVGCFSGDSSVLLVNGGQKSIGHLRTGDRLLAVDHFNISSSEMFLMLDKETSKIVMFYTFTTASNHQISLTGLHLMPIASSNEKLLYIAARDIQLGDQFYVSINNRLETSPIVNITNELKQGYFAPLTMTGTILVNNIYASCFASVTNHELAQMFMAPFRWYYQLMRYTTVTDPFDNNHSDGIHWFVKLIYDFMSFLQPSGLQVS